MNTIQVLPNGAQNNGRLMYTMAALTPPFGTFKFNEVRAFRVELAAIDLFTSYAAAMWPVSILL